MKVADYISAAMALPQPTPQQTLSYARFVTTAHGWYKRLFFPDIELFFLLDPNVATVANKDTGWMPMQDYRRRFGHWTCIQAENQVADLEISADLMQAGMARVNAFMYGPDFDERMAASRGPLTETARIECSPLSVPKPGAAFVWMGRPQGDPMLALPPGIAAALQPLLVLWRESALREERTEAPLLKTLAAELDRERERQIGLMVEAMNRFVAALSSARRA